MEHDEILNCIITPYDADEVQALLDKHDLASKYPDLARNLRQGFPMGDFPDSLPSTVIFPNDISVTDNTDFVNQYIQEEISASRMSGPYTQQEAETILKGPFQCSPMLVSVQRQGPGVPDKLCLCRNLSKGTKHDTSTNSYVDKGKFPTKVGTASNVADIVSTAHPTLFPSLLPYPTLFPTSYPCSTLPYSRRTHTRVPTLSVSTMSPRACAYPTCCRSPTLPRARRRWFSI
jgi:hypothetical protein